jgi:hypothetical protein
MQTYITQLLSDLKEAQNNRPEKVDYSALYPNHPAASPEYDGVLDHIIEWETAPEWKMDDLFEINSAVFPPVERLNEAQTALLVGGILELWASFNICADILNDKIPVKTIYKVLVNYWKTEMVQYISEGTLHLEFCHYDENDCPWGYEFCSCKDFGKDDASNRMTVHEHSDESIVDFDNFERDGFDEADFDGDDLPF